MRRIAVDSTSIASIGYEPHRRELEIEFIDSRNVYRYFEVPADEYDEFMAAKSKGTYLNHVFKARGYPYMLVKRGRE
jgi:KTSC domain